MEIIMINENNGHEPMLIGRSIESAKVHEAVDISVLTSFEPVHHDGQPDLVVELIDLYFDDAPRKLKSMRAAVTLGDTAALGRAAHGLKGSSASLGAFQMATLCNELEANADTLSSNGLNTFLAEIENEFERVCIAFAAERQTRVPAVGNH